MGQRTYLDRAAILAVPDLEIEEIYVPKPWDTWLRVKGLTARERDEWEESCLSGKGKNVKFNADNLRTKLVVRTVVDEHGKRIFSNADADQLGDKSGAMIDIIYDVAARLSGVSDQDVEELTKNSESGAADGSPSA